MQNQQKMRKEYLYMALMCIGITMLIIILIIVGGCEPRTTEGGAGESVSVPEKDASSQTPVQDASRPGEDQSDIEISLPKEYITIQYPTESKNSGILALTNAEYMILSQQAPSGLANIYANKNEHYGLSGNSLVLNLDAIKALNKMIKAFEESKGENNLIVFEAYTNNNSVWENPVKLDLSNGYTVNFSTWPPDEDGEAIGTGKYIWMVDNCSRFGYIVRYPAEKTSFTKVSGSGSERIYRYVGYEHAAYMAQWHLCLEQYIDAVRNATFEEPIVISYEDSVGDQKTCFVYYIAASDGDMTDLKIRGGEETVYSISGDGSSGFIVACYE
jgi:D-alanyl-D-alanine carboxypeptidase